MRNENFVNASKFIGSLDDIDVTTETIGESYSTIICNDMVIDVTTINEKRAVIFYSKNRFTKVYYPDNIKVGHKDYETHGKQMISFKTDDLWWYEERIPNFPSAFSGIGTDMSMPFLKQQDWQNL